MNRRETHLGRLMVGVVLATMLVAAGAAAALEVGDQAPDFTLPSTTGKEVRLSQFRGKKHVLIQFYSTDFNPT